MPPSPIYVFDGHCVLCSKAVAYILKYESRPDTRFVAILSGEGRKLARAHNIDPENPASFLYVEGEAAYQSSDAVLAIIRNVGGPGRILRLGKILPKPVRDYLYRTMAQNRYRIFGRTDICYVPTPETRSRFVLE